jgi:glycine oxidase
MMLVNPKNTLLTAEIAVIGSGLIGRLVALYLKRLGANIILYDQSDQKGTASAARAAAGLLTPLSESLLADNSIVDMGLKSLHLWPEILASLQGYNFFQRQGSLVISHPQDKSQLQYFHQHVSQHYGENSCQQLDRKQLAQLEPSLAKRFSSALFLADEGQIGNRKLIKSLGEQLIIEQVDWQLSAKVSAVKPYHFVVNGQQKKADLVIDCRGTGAINSLAGLRAVRGELFQLFAPEVNITRPVRLMHPRYQLYIAPKPNKHFVVGATEIESNDNGEMTVRSALELLSAAYTVDSAFAEARILEQVSACRPAFMDNNPAIFQQQGLIHINGLYRHGFLLAPVVLQQALVAVQQCFGLSCKDNGNVMNNLIKECK